MPRRYELTWHSARTCWKKYHNGRHYYLAKGKCRGKSDQAGYGLALEEWHWLKERIEHRPNGSQLRAVSMPAGDYALPMATAWDRLAGLPTTAKLVELRERKVEDLIGVLLGHDYVRAQAGQISMKDFANRKSALQDFRLFAAKHSHVEMSGNDGMLLSDYRIQLIYMTNPTKPEHKADQISGHTVRRRLREVKRLYTWAWEQTVIDSLPRTLNRQFTNVDTKRPDPRYFSPDQVRTLFDAASQRTKLYIALALNCGYRQTDISTLANEDVDWTAGVIDRPRHKTGMKQRHKLWSVTLDLLKAERAGTKGPVLLSETGHGLYRESLAGEGAKARLVHIDVIGLAFNRVLDKLDMNGSFRMLRNSGANEIAKKYQESPELTDAYLAHTEKRMRKHYADRHYDLLFSALDHLNTIFRLK